MNDLVKIIFIGTGSGVTSLNRFHSSFIIDNNNFRLLVDAGDSVSRALMKSEINFDSIDAIVISHFHPDHICGLPSLLIQMKINKRKKSLGLFVHRSLVESIHRLLISTYIFKENFGFDLTINEYNYADKLIINETITINAFHNSHLDKYQVISTPVNISLASSSFMFTIAGKKIFYTGDVGSPHDLEIIKEISIRKIDALISETTHLEPDEIVKTAELYKPDIIVLTHIGDDVEDKIESFVLNHPGKPAIIKAFDGLEVDL